MKYHQGGILTKFTKHLYEATVMRPEPGRVGNISTTYIFINFHPHNLLCRGRKIMICIAFFSKFCQKSTFYSISTLILHFTKEEAEVRKQAFPFVTARYIRTFDVITGVNCVFLRRKRRFQKVAIYPNFDVISEVICVF